ncbi:MAG: RES family NAD+ phosphorylase [Chitinophagaceae bacterium]
MDLFRLTSSVYKDDLSGYGAFLYGGRWNSKGNVALYAASSISLALLEILVNMKGIKMFTDLSYHLMQLRLDEDEIIELKLSQLKKGWEKDKAYTQFIGDQFLMTNQKVALKIPSVIIPQENNYLLNPNHPFFKKRIKLVKTEKYELDKRLLI